MVNFEMSDWVQKEKQREHENRNRRWNNYHERKMQKERIKATQEEAERERAFKREENAQEQANWERAFEQTQNNWERTFNTENERKNIELALTIEKNKVANELAQAEIAKANAELAKQTALNIDAALDKKKKDEYVMCQNAIFTTLQGSHNKIQNVFDHDGDPNTPNVEAFVIDKTQFDSILPTIARRTNGQVTSIKAAYIYNGNLIFQDANTGRSDVLFDSDNMYKIISEGMTDETIVSYTDMYNSNINRKRQKESRDFILNNLDALQKRISYIDETLTDIQKSKSGTPGENGQSLASMFGTDEQRGELEQDLIHERANLISLIGKSTAFDQLPEGSKQVARPPENNEKVDSKEEETPEIKEGKNPQDMKSFVYENPKTGEKKTIQAKSIEEANELAKEMEIREQPLYRMDNRTEEAEILTAKGLTDKEKEILTTTPREILYSFMEGRDLKDVSNLMNIKSIRKAVSKYNYDIDNAQIGQGYKVDGYFFMYSPTDIVFESEEAQKKYDKIVKPLLESSDESKVAKGKALFNDLRKTSEWAQRDYAGLVDEYSELVNSYHRSQRFKVRARIAVELESLRKQISILDELVNSKVQ